MLRDTAAIPEGRRVYAVGDIHGRIDLLEEIQAAILADANNSTADELTVVYLGDYVDRGRRSYEVVDWLANVTLPGISAVYLRGNHEEMMLTFVEGRLDPLWLVNGGIATIESYGVPFDWGVLDASSLEEMRCRLVDAVPESHRRFFDALQLSYTCGDYLFVHAGVRPGRPLELQDPRDLIWIRSQFLVSEADFGKRVVHGHTIVDRPEVKPNRIGIDTGAFHTGRLTCLVLEGRMIRFLHT